MEVRLENLQKDTTEGTLDEEVVAKVFDGVEVAETEIATGWELLQSVVLLSYLLSDPRAHTVSDGIEWWTYLRRPRCVICLPCPT